ncbi:MAG: tRNA pseudouridine(55) synthase TruB [Eubacteriales bacterium]
MDGFLNVLKPPGMTSHDVVHFIRNVSGIKKAGHTGTLDPGAAGVLVICLGRATRLARFLPGGDKEYRAEMTLGVSTDTGDSYGTVLEVHDASDINEDRLAAALELYTGRIEQVPPMTSAVRHRGKKLYELARAGIEVDRPARQVHIYSLKLIRGSGWGTNALKVLINVVCSRGTYIRSLCEDIGKSLGCGAHMSFLVRTRDGAFDISCSSTLEEIRATAYEGSLQKVLVSIDHALGSIPSVQVKEGAARSVSSGASLYQPGVELAPDVLTEGALVRLQDSHSLLALAETRRDAEHGGRYFFKPVCVLSQPE